MNDIRKNLDTLSKLDEGILDKLLSRGAAKIKPGPATEIPPFDPASPAAQAAAAKRQVKQQQATARIQGQAPKDAEVPSTILGPDGRPLTTTEPPPQVFRPTQRGPGYKSPYDDVEVPKTDTTIPDASAQSGDDILKGIEAAKEMIRQGQRSKTQQRARAADRFIKKHSPDIATAATAYTLYQNWDEIKDLWDRYNIKDIPGAQTAEDFLAGQIKNLNDYLFKKNEPTTVKEDVGSDPNDWAWDSKKKVWRHTGPGEPSVGRTVSMDRFETEIYKPYLQSIESDPDYKVLQKAAQETFKTGQGKSIVGHVLDFLNPKKNWKKKGAALVGTASGAELWAPDYYKPSAAWKRGIERYQQSDDQSKPPQPTTSAPASTTTPAQPSPTVVPPTTTTPAAGKSKPETPSSTSPTDRADPFSYWGTGRGRVGSNENASAAHKKYIREYKRYIDSV